MLSGFLRPAHSSIYHNKEKEECQKNKLAIKRNLDSHVFSSPEENKEVSHCPSLSILSLKGDQSKLKRPQNNNNNDANFRSKLIELPKSDTPNQNIAQVKNSYNSSTIEVNLKDTQIQIKSSGIPSATDISNQDKPSVIKYLSNQRGNFMCFSSEYFAKITPGKNLRVPGTVLCGAEGCKNRKRYSCSKTNVPLCSLLCYRKNLEKFKSS